MRGPGWIHKAMPSALEKHKACRLPSDSVGAFFNNELHHLPIGQTFPMGRLPFFKEIGSYEP